MIGKRLSHYRIVERIGAGGMGVVYRAHDEDLDRDVAIKVLPAGSLTDDTARKRFRKEALSLARLNHPNVATVHEFGTEGDIDFLVTEFIPGITLDAKLAAGPIAPREAMRLGMQLAAGLHAAHEQGIIHRDLKPANLRLTTDGRLKILDFGLAQLTPHASEMGMTVTMTKSQETSGTLPYMSPEQLSGEVADARTDVWSAGAVLYEMVVGKRPFQQSVHALLINAILNQSPEPPSTLNAAIPASLEAIILKALERNRTQRYQTAAELGAALETAATPSATSSSSTAVPSIAKHPYRSRVLSAAALIIIIAAIVFVRYRTPRPGVSSQANRRQSIAVLGFKNVSDNPEKSWLSTAISEMLTTELSQGDQLRTIPGESVAQMKASLALPDEDSFSQQTLARIRQNLGSDTVVMGSYVPLGNGVLRLDVRMQDAVAGVTLASVSEKGNESEIDDLVSRAGAELRSKLGVGALSLEQSALVKASLPTNPEAARLYSQGLQRLRLYDALAARDLLEKAASLEPDYALTHSALAEAWSSLGYEAKATEQAKRAVELSSRFSPEDRLLIAGRAHELLSETPEAIESYRSLVQSFPDNIDYGLLLIRAQVAAGHADAAEMTLADLRPHAVSEADIARLDLAEARIASALSDFKRSQVAAERATARGRAIGANLLVAQALQAQSQTWVRLGPSEKAVAFANQARELYVSAGERRAAARCLLTIGDVAYNEGDFDNARKQFETALAEFREIGAQKSIYATYERLGNVAYSRGQLHEAMSYYERNEKFHQETNDPGGLASDYGNLANTLDGLGDIPGAMKMQQQALAAFKQVGDRRGTADTMNNTGIIFVEMGDLASARKYYEDALSLARELSYQHGQTFPMAGIGDTLFYGGDLAGARKQYEDALALCKSIGDEDYGGQVSIQIAALDLFEKKYSDGEALAAQAANHFEKANSWGNAAWAQAVLARILLREGKLKEAQAAATKSVKMSQLTPGQSQRYEATIADARVKARLGNLAAARNGLTAMIASTQKAGNRIYELLARLALVEIDADSGAASAGVHISALEKDARARGIGLVADQAHALLSAKTSNATLQP